MRTMLRALVAGAVIVGVLGLPGLAAAQQAAGGPPKDVPGWRDLAWGATPEQAAAKLGKPLGEPRKDPDGRTLYRIMDFPVGAWTTNLVLIFSGSDRLALSAVMINFRRDEKFQAVVDEMTARYGPPTSTKSETENEGRIQIKEADWLFPTTEIKCRWRDVWGIVVYQPRQKDPS